MTIYKFRNCFLNTTERCVFSDGKHLELSSKALDVLQLLVERSGSVVTKDEILGTIWNGSFVEEGNLPVHISKLRRTLGESKVGRFIETVQGTGYRFVAPVKSVNADVWARQLAGDSRRRSDKTTKVSGFGSIAVLPLRNESDNPEINYLAEGLSESLINELSRLSGLRVIARNTVFRYKDVDFDAIAVGETLGVSRVLTGRIKLINDQIIISVELVKVDDGSQLWGKQFNQPFSNILKIQEEITSAVSGEIRHEIGRVAPTRASGSITQNVESYRLYLKGKFFQEKHTKVDIYKAIGYFQKSILHDPTNILPYVETVRCYRFLYIFDQIQYEEVLARIKPHLVSLSGMDQSNDALQVMYGEIKLQLDWDVEAARNHIRDALILNPNSIAALFRYSEVLILSNLFSEAMVYINQILEIDPLSMITYKRVARLLYQIGNYEQAEIYLDDVLEMEPNDFEALNLLGAVLTELKRFSEALTVFHKARSIYDEAETLSMIGYIYALEGKKMDAQRIIEELRLKSASNFDNHEIKVARVYAALNENEKAIEYLYNSFDRHEIDLTALDCDPRWDQIRDNPQFKELIQLIGVSSKYVTNIQDARLSQSFR